MDILKEQIEKLANDGKVTMKHLQLCVHCGKLGHLGYTCQVVWKNLYEDRLKEIVRLLDEYKKENNIQKETEEDRSTLKSLLQENSAKKERKSDAKKAVIDGKDPLSCQISRLRYKHKVC